MRYALSLLLLVVVGTLAFGGLAELESGVRQDSHRVNVAGRQRMLSQRVAYQAELVVTAPGPTGRVAARDRLGAVLARMRGEHAALLSGDPALGLPPADAAQLARLQGPGGSLQADFEAFWGDGERVLAGGPAAATARDRMTKMANGPLLARLDEVVTGFDADSSVRLERLHRLILASGAGLVVVGAVVLVPLGLALRREHRALAESVGALQTREAALREAGAFHDAVLSASPDTVYVLDLATSSTVWSSRHMLGLLGYTEQQLQDLGEQMYGRIVHPADVETLREANTVAVGLADGEVLAGRYRVRHADGHWVWLSRRSTPFRRDDAGAVSQVLCVSRDVTSVVNAEQELARAALHDPLTGLPNRVLLADRLASALSRRFRTGEAVPVLFCDLDGFKQVNDTSGHAAGDAVLVATADRLRQVLRPQDTVARVGGDEFVVVLESGPDFRTSPSAGPEPSPTRREEVLAVADRVRAALGEPVAVGTVVHRVGVSIGVSFALPGADVDQALREADAAMYRAKAGGRARTAVHEPVSA